MNSANRGNLTDTGVLDACRYFLPRLLFLNGQHAPQLHWGDVVLALNSISLEQVNLATAEFWELWLQKFREIADNYCEAARGSMIPAHTRRYLKSAAAAYHWAEFMYFSDATIKFRLRQAVKDCFWNSIDPDLNVFSAEMLWYGIKIPYYILLPKNNHSTKPPCVILSNGLDSVTEVEIMSFAQLFLESGMAVMLFDGPGQGINLGQNPLVNEMENVVKALLDEVVNYDSVDWSRLGFFGVSFGGYFALRIAKYLGNKFQMVVNYSGGPRLNQYEYMKRRLKADFKFAMMEDREDLMQSRFNQLQLNFSDTKLSNNLKVLSIHGEYDDIFPLEHLQQMDSQLVGQHELIIYKGESHVCLNYLNSISIIIAHRFCTHLN